MASDAGGTYNGNPFPASATATGIGNASVSGSFAYTYYVGSAVTNSGSSTAPTGRRHLHRRRQLSRAPIPNYSSTSSAPLTFTISPATPSVVASDAGGTYSGNPFPANATATGIGNASVSGSFAYTYYVGSSHQCRVIDTRRLPLAPTPLSRLSRAPIPITAARRTRR